MLVSASRRTDIPAFYTPWLLGRLRAGFAVVPNPFNPRQASTVSLRPEDAAAFIFWTRNPRPLAPHLPEIAGRGQETLFLHTLLDYPRALEPHTPDLEAAVAGFVALSRQIGAERVIWRYDPIVPSTVTDAAFHLRTFARIARALAGHTRRVIISLVECYRKTRARLAPLADLGLAPQPPDQTFLDALMPGLVRLATAHDMEIQSCAQALDLEPYGITRGRCLDPDYLRRHLGLDVPDEKDPGQRPLCGCAPSRDIGMYDTCLCGCAYCYATSSFDQARENRRRHDPAATSLVAPSAAESAPRQHTLPGMEKGA